MFMGIHCKYQHYDYDGIMIMEFYRMFFSSGQFHIYWAKTKKDTCNSWLSLWKEYYYVLFNFLKDQSVGYTIRFGLSL